MYLNKKVKEGIFKKHGKSEKDTGSAEGQIALFSHRINHLSNHLKKNQKDRLIFVYILLVLMVIIVIIGLIY